MSKYWRFIKIEHTLFSLPIVFAGTVLAVSKAGGALTWTRAAWIFLAVLGARAAGFGLNRVVDKSIDAQNPRTRNREIPSGQISIAEAWTFIALSSALFLFAAWKLSPLCLKLTPIPLALFALYPFLKRFTCWAHLGLGLAWGTAPLGGWLAARPQAFPLSDLAPALLLSGFCVLWVAGFDILYALLDEEFDRANDLHSMPAALGRNDALRAAQLFHAFGFLFLGTLTHLYINAPLAHLLLATAGGMLVVSHWKMINEPLTPPLIDFAFFKMNAALGFIVLFLTLANGLKGG